MRFISPRLICRFSFLLTITVACLAGARAEAGQTPNSPPCCRQHECNSHRKWSRGGNGARSQDEDRTGGSDRSECL